MRLFRFTWAIPVTFIVILTANVVFAQVSYPRHLIVTGGGYNQPLDPFYNALASRAAQFKLPAIQILVIPVGIGSNPNAITDAERTAQLATAEQQRQEIEASCTAYVSQNSACRAILLPVFTHNDVLASPALAEFTSHPDGIIFLQTSAKAILEVIRGTDLEQDIKSAYQDGSIISGPGNLFSNIFIYGFRPKFGPASAMTFGAVHTGSPTDEGGLAIFPQQVILDTLPFSENRFGRLLNAITGPGDPHIGIGIEANSGFEFSEDSNLGGFFGESLVAILDAESYQSANALSYQPGTNLIGIRNVLLQLVAPGSSSYDLSQRQSSLAPIKDRLPRSFDSLTLPAGAGTIMLTSDLINDTSAMEMLTEFSNLSGGQNARLLILAIGYPDRQSAQSEAAQITTRLEVPSDTIYVQPESDEQVQLESDITGVILTGPDVSLVRPEALQTIQSSWLTGLPILADRAGAAILGNRFPSKLLPDQGSAPFTPSRYTLRAGLGFVQAIIDPYAFEKDSWERIFISAYQFPTELVFGIAPDAALKLDPDSSEIIGTNVVSLVDFRAATLTASDSELIGVANGLIDIYAPGEHVRSLVADKQAAPLHAPTPVLGTAVVATVQNSSPTPTATIVGEEIQPEPTEAPRSKPPTRTPRPTSTPVPTPPPSDPGTTNLMVFFGVLSVVVVIVGVWLNRQATVE